MLCLTVSLKKWNEMENYRIDNAATEEMKA